MIRRLTYNDYDSHMKLLAQLSDVGTITKEQFDEFVLSQNKNFSTLIWEENGHEVACITILIEKKLIHSGFAVMHIEDVVTHSDFRGKGFCSKLIESAINIAKYNCYKIILNCNDENVEFYTKLGFKRHSNQMRMEVEQCH